MKAYLDILEKILEKGKLKPNRTGVDTLSITGYMFEHDMSEGFPLLTTKKMGLKNIDAELEFFIKGLTDKNELHKRNCHIWDEWASPSVVNGRLEDEGFNVSMYGSVELAKEARNKRRLEIQREEDYLGPIYGFQWRNWMHSDGIGRIDQLKNVVEKLKTNPLDRRMIVSAWRPDEFELMALPPCHFAFQVLSDGTTIDLLWSQRSCDTPLGIPYNIAEYALLLLLLAKESGLKPGKLIGFLADVHIYVNQIENVKLQLSRTPTFLPTVDITNFTSIFDWKYTDFVINNYNPQEKIEFPLAI